MNNKEYHRNYYQAHKEKMRSQMRAYWENNKDRFKEKSRKWREVHRTRNIEYCHQYYLAHHEEALETQRLYYQNHKKQAADWYKEYYKNHIEKRKQDLKKSNKLIKIEVLTYYGNGKCACIKCGCTDINALTIDHVNGNGERHRKAIGTRPIYRWLKNNHFPLGYQTLCNNCNFIKKIKNGEVKAHNLKYTIENSDNPQKLIESRRRMKANRLLTKFKVLSHYGGGKAVCVKCGFDDLRALTIDHIKNDGSSHRKDIGRRTIYSWLVYHNYPEGYKTLCANCNLIKKIENGEYSNARKKIKNNNENLSVSSLGYEGVSPVVLVDL